MKFKLILWLLLVCSISYTQEVYELDTKYPVHDLNTHLKVYADSTDSFTPKLILNDSALSYRLGNELPKILKVGTTYWGKLNVITKDSLKGWTLHFEDKIIGPPAWTKSNGKIDVYAYVNNQLFFHKKSGVEYPKKERDSKANWVLNNINIDNLPINTPISIIIKAQGNSIGYPAYFNLSARSPKQPHYHQIYQFHNSFNIFMFGVTFIVFLFYILQFVYLKQSVFFWFSLWLMFCMLTQAMTIGLIIGSVSILRHPILLLISTGIYFTFWFFGRSFVESKKKYPLLDKFMLGLALFFVIETLATVFYKIVFNPPSFFTSVGIHYQLLNIYTIGSLILSIILTFKKDSFARYFGIGSLIASVFLIIGTLWSSGILSFRIGFDPYVTGMFLQIIIYAFGIAYRQQKVNQKAQEEKLQSERTMAEIQRMKDLDEIKTRFFANISHEFRTPLSLISGPITKAFKKRNNEDEIILSKRNYDIISNNTLRLQSLIDQLLDLSKLESGKVHLSLKQGGIISLIRSIVFSFESMAERNNISLNTSFPEEINHAFYDKDKLEKIVTNILSNAFKYTSENGSVTVNIDYTNHYLNIEITDTGKGISKEDIKRIFDRFYRIEGNEEKGSGIGLALTKELIDLHNGKISVDSVKNQGSTFKIRLPISLDNLPQAISIVEKQGTLPKSELFQKKNETQISPELITNKQINKQLPVVLVVEDNKDLQYYISDVLKEKYNIQVAQDGLQGERMAFEHIPDIILSDIMMPKKDGYQLCNALKTNTKTSHIPIIMLTAKAGHDNKIEGLTHGADAYLTKPFNEDELLLLMKNLIESRKKLWEHFKALDMLLVDNIDVSSIDDKFLQKVFKVIKDNLDNDQFGVEDIAKHVGFSRSQLHRKLKALSDKSANQLITEIRLNEAHRMLKQKTGTVSEIAYSVGYSNLSYFTKSFKEKFGTLPSKV